MPRKGELLKSEPTQQGTYSAANSCARKCEVHIIVVKHRLVASHVPFSEIGRERAPIMSKTT